MARAPSLLGAQQELAHDRAFDITLCVSGAVSEVLDLCAWTWMPSCPSVDLQSYGLGLRSRL